MLTMQNVMDMAVIRFGEDADIRVRRANGGWPFPCGFEVEVWDFDEVPSKFFHESLSLHDLQGSMIRFAESVFYS